MITYLKNGNLYNQPIKRIIVDSYSELAQSNLVTHTIALVLVDETQDNKSTIRVKSGSGNWVVVPETIFADF